MHDSVLPWVLEILLEVGAKRWAASWTLEDKAPALTHINPAEKLVGGRAGVSVEVWFTESLYIWDVFWFPAYLGGREVYT